MKKKGKLIDAILLIGILVGVLIFLFPRISDLYYSNKVNKEIETYTTKTNELKDTEIDERMFMAQAYNKSLLVNTGIGVSDPFSKKDLDKAKKEYAKMLEVNEQIAYLEIPKINLKLPIFAGTDEEILQKGVGHLEKTSLPIGGASTHSVVTAHRGLLNKKLFTDLDKLEIGDRFYVKNLKETIAYQVSDINIIEPTDYDKLQIEKDKDQMTLLTCTPYMVNSHRLLVTGQRIMLDEGIFNHDIKVSQIETRYFRMFIGVSIISVILLIIIVILIGRNKNLKKRLEYQDK